MPPSPLVSFKDFIASLHQNQPQHFLNLLEYRVAGQDEFEEMRNHLLEHYRGVEVTHSFVDESGQIFDCIPIEQQPAARGREVVATPPDLPGHDASQPAQPKITQLAPGRLDPHGNAMTCPPGTVPIRRVTMQELTRFQSLRHFFQKSPAGGQHPRLGGIPPAQGEHKYAHAYQTVPNLGGQGFLNIWAPAVGSQIFSLSQHWYAGGANPVQTAEVGWQVYPQKYGTTQPVLFIYWTADGYQNTGCYNLDCGNFVQTNSNWALGGAITPSSVAGGAQYDLLVSFHLADGKWWLYIEGTSAADAVGYYPASQYGAGPLATAATNIDFGGETVNVTAWPPMGSGAMASAGYLQAAYQRGIAYFPAGGRSAVPAALALTQPSPNCYTILDANSQAQWGTAFYFGGPGGGNC